MKDMKHYYKLGYGHKLAHQVASPLLRNILSSLIDHVQGRGEPSQLTLSAFFGHAETVVPLLCLFGLYRDPDLGHFKADSPATLREQRNFQTSTIAPFGANVVFSLYQCPPLPSDKASGRHSSYRVLLKHNEQQTHIPGCSHMFCPFRELRSISERVLGEIGDFTTLCEPRDDTSLFIQWYTAIISPLLMELALYSTIIGASAWATRRLAAHKAAMLRGEADLKLA